MRCSLRLAREPPGDFGSKSPRSAPSALTTPFFLFAIKKGDVEDHGRTSGFTGDCLPVMHDRLVAINRPPAGRVDSCPRRIPVYGFPLRNIARNH